MKAMAIVILSVAMVLGSASASSAAGEIELSRSGSVWAPTLGSPLFTTPPALVPMSSESASFWVRNSSPDAAYLRITVENATWAGAEYAAQLTIGASVPGVTGTPRAISTSSACTVLLERVLLAAGQSVQVTTTLALGDLDGSVGQGGSAAMDIGIVLEQSAGSAPASGCAGTTAPTPTPTPSTFVVVVPPRADGTASAAAPVAPPSEVEVIIDALEPLPEPLLSLLPNTLVRFDSSLLAYAFAGLPLGAAAFFLIGLIRRQLSSEERAKS